jgi:hypothetical protein
MLAPNICGEALLRVSPQDIVILPHHNILLKCITTDCKINWDFKKKKKKKNLLGSTERGN